jgi:hypothetical protein
MPKEFQSDLAMNFSRQIICSSDLPNMGGDILSRIITKAKGMRQKLIRSM